MTHTVDAPAHWEVYSTPLPSPITGFKGASRQERIRGDYRIKLQKGKAEEKLKGNEKRGRREENGEWE